MAKANKVEENNTEVNDTTVADAVDKAPAKPKVEIIRGRMPAAMVYAVRFGNLAESPTDKQRMFATTLGKIYDIEKNRNFAYITEDTKFTQSQIDDAVEWLSFHPAYEEGNAKAVETYLKKLKVATDEEAAKFEEVRKASRGQTSKTKDGETANAGGGNRRKRSTDPKEVDDEADPKQVEEVSADDLLG